MTVSRPNEQWLQSKFVENRVRGIIDAETLWEKLLVHQPIDSPTFGYYQEQYFDIETPNDAAKGRTLDPAGRKPVKRGEGGAYPRTGVSQAVRKFVELSEDALAVDYLEEELKYPAFVNQIFKKQNKIGKQFASNININTGNTLTENWSATPSTIQYSAVGSGNEWSLGPGDTTVDIIHDVIAAQEKIENVPGYSYKATALIVNKDTLFDLKEFFTKKNFELGYNKPNTFNQIPDLDINLVVSDMVKADFAVMGDFAACGVFLESSPLRIETLENKETHKFTTQVDRTYGFALTDPKAICTISNVVG
jgi:hypothetical protein